MRYYYLKPLIVNIIQLVVNEMDNDQITVEDFDTLMQIKYNLQVALTILLSAPTSRFRPFRRVLRSAMQ